MYKDIISYQLAADVTEAHLLKVAGEIIENWMRKQQGFQKWEIHKNSDDSYTDIVYWNNKTDAKAAEAKMMDVPNGAAWFACYLEGSITSQNLEKIQSFVQVGAKEAIQAQTTIEQYQGGTLIIILLSSLATKLQLRCVLVASSSLPKACFVACCDIFEARASYTRIPKLELGNEK